MAVKTYDPSKVIIVFAGRVLSGFAEGTKVTVEHDEDAWTTQIGVDGEGTRSKSNNRSGTITVELMQSSDDNLFLYGIYEIDRNSNAGALPLLVKDGSGTSIHMAETAWISKLPSAEYAIEAGAREWIFKTDILVSALGGN